MTNLSPYRNDKQYWRHLCCDKAQSEDRGSYDSNEKKRYAVLLSLQYDFKDTDEDLIRYLFEQEIIARENDSFQGIGDSLWLGAYLLARFKRAADIPLFYRAKFANFDTGCGFDREFMFLALRDKTEEYVCERFPEIHKEIKDDFSSLDLEQNLDNWWDGIANQFPKSEKDESLLELYQRSLYFENTKAATHYLKEWEQAEPDSSNKDSTLKYAYIELGDFSKAIELLKKELQTKETNWDRASCNRDLLKFYTKMGAPAEGLDIIQQIDQCFSQFNDWRQVGLGRMAIHEAFNYVLATKDIELAKAAFKIAHGWFKKMDNIAFVGLEAGWKAADKCGFSWKSRMYKKLANKEQQRINSI